MKHFLLCFILLIAYAGVDAQSGKAISAGKLVEDTRNVYAVVVGISAYLEKDIPGLQYANQDAQIFAEYLQSKPGGAVPAENIQLLIDTAATTGAVYDAIYWLRTVCKKGDLVYFYFSGHGDLENATMYNNGFLICYNSPPNNYVKLSLSIDYLNDVANTLSAQVQADVVLITDACHSGKLAGSKYKGNYLVGQQLSAVKNREIRIMSCADNQLSNEGDDWGGGRGVFSYYLINGLKGLADAGSDGHITVNNLKYFLDSAFVGDPVLKRENLVQTPVLKGNGSFLLAKVDAAAKEKARQEMRAGTQTVVPVSQVAEELPARADNYFFYLIKRQNLEVLTDSLRLYEKRSDQIPFTIIRQLKEAVKTDAARDKLDELEKELMTDTVLLKRFNGKLAVCFDDKGQEVIDQYLRGDEAELERRRYYNVKNSGYDVYPKMFATAIKLTQPDNYLYGMLLVKLHYFSGVNARLKMPFVANPQVLLDQALAEQKKALALEEHAAYIYNELGVIYLLKKDFKQAETLLLQASQMSPEWVVPWSNLLGLYAYTGNFEKGMDAAQHAQERQKDFQGTFVNSGILHEKKGNLLHAEELFRQSIYINSRHYVPFEHLGNVYLHTTQYAMADSFYYEASIRKKGFHFLPPKLQPDVLVFPLIVEPPFECAVDSNDVKPNDVLGQFALGKIAYEQGKLVTAEKRFRRVIALDPSNPLVFHWLGNLLYDQRRWQEAEIIFKLAVNCYVDKKFFGRYCDSVIRRLPESRSKKCIGEQFRQHYYQKIEDHYFLGSLYEAWNHFNEAEAEYTLIIASDTSFVGGYYKLWRMMEKAGRYEEAEAVIKSYRVMDKKIADKELNGFYERILQRYPDDGGWNYKAGLFLYQLAASRLNGFPADRKIVQPDTHSEDYVPIKKSKISEDEEEHTKLPGINEPVIFAKQIFYPRNAGIDCLLKTDSLLTADNNTLADINNKIGDLYFWQGLTERARKPWQKSIDLDPGNANTRLKLIDADDVLGHFGEAFAQLDSLYQRKEINFSKQLLLSKYLVHDGGFARAGKVLNEAEEMHPYTIPGIIDLKARMQLLSQHPEEALAMYHRYATINKNTATGNYNIARLYAKLGKTSEAWTWLEAAFKSGFNYSFVLEADPYLDSLRKSAQWGNLLKRYTFKKYETKKAG